MITQLSTSDYASGLSVTPPVGSDGGSVRYSASPGGMVRASTWRSSGKWYFEITPSNYTSNFCYIALTTVDCVLADGIGTGLGADDQSWGFRAQNVTIGSNLYRLYGKHNGLDTWKGDSPGFQSTTHDRWSLAIDLDAGKVWFFVNGVCHWGDPVAGTGATYDNIPTGVPIYPAVYTTLSSPSAYAYFGPSGTLNYTPPTGFAPYGQADILSYSVPAVPLLLTEQEGFFSPGYRKFSVPSTPLKLNTPSEVLIVPHTTTPLLLAEQEGDYGNAPLVGRYWRLHIRSAASPAAEQIALSQIMVTDRNDAELVPETIVASSNDPIWVAQGKLPTLPAQPTNPYEYAVILSPDEKSILVAHDGSATAIGVSVFDRATYSKSQPFQYLKKAEDACYSPDGRYIAVCDQNGGAYGFEVFRIYEVATGNYRSVNNPYTQFSITISALSWSPNGRYIAVGHTAQIPYLFFVDTDNSDKVLWERGADWTNTDSSGLSLAAIMALSVAGAGYPFGFVTHISWSSDSRHLGVSFFSFLDEPVSGFYVYDAPRETSKNFDLGYHFYKGVGMSPSHLTSPFTYGRGVSSAFSPDGRYLCFSQEYVGGTVSGVNHALRIFERSDYIWYEVTGPVLGHVRNWAQLQFSADGQVLFALADGVTVSAVLYGRKLYTISAKTWEVIDEVDHDYSLSYFNHGFAVTKDQKEVYLLSYPGSGSYKAYYMLNTTANDAETLLLGSGEWISASNHGVPTSNDPQRIEIDFGTVVHVKALAITEGSDPDLFMDRYSISSSADGVYWRLVAFDRATGPTETVVTSTAVAAIDVDGYAKHFAGEHLLRSSLWDKPRFYYVGLLTQMTPPIEAFHEDYQRIRLDISDTSFSSGFVSLYTKKFSYFPATVVGWAIYEKLDTGLILTKDSFSSSITITNPLGLELTPGSISWTID